MNWVDERADVVVGQSVRHLDDCRLVHQDVRVIDYDCHCPMIDYGYHCQMTVIHEVVIVA